MCCVSLQSTSATAELPDLVSSEDETDGDSQTSEDDEQLEHK